MALLNTLQNLASTAPTFETDPADLIFRLISEALQEEASKGNTSFVIHRNSIVAKGELTKYKQHYTNQNVDWVATLNTVRTMLEAEGLTVLIQPTTVTIMW